MIPFFVFFMPISCASHSMMFINCSGISFMHDVPFEFLQPQDRNSIEVGTVVAYSPTVEQRYNGCLKGLCAHLSYIVHRIIGRTPNGYIIKGDNNDAADNEFYGTIQSYQVSYKML